MDQSNLEGVGKGRGELLDMIMPLDVDYIGTLKETYEAKLEEWKETTPAQAIEENRADAVDTSRAVLKGKIAEQIAPLLPGFLAKYNAADARFIGSPIGCLIFRNMTANGEFSSIHRTRICRKSGGNPWAPRRRVNPNQTWW